jgi:ParB/RepB/Spo0J family partition protein
VIKRVSLKQVRVDQIVVLPRRRQPTNEQVETLRKSLLENGLLSPISLRIPEHLEVDGRRLDGRPVLVFGATRLAAAKALGWEEILADIVDGTEIDFLKAQIAENLHRAELTALERNEQLAAYERLLQDEARAEQEPKCEDVSAGELFAASCRKKVGHRPKGSISPTSRRTAAAELGVDEKALRRAEKIAALSPEAKDAARTTGLDENQRALLEVAEEPTPSNQVAKIYRLADHRRDARRPAPSTNTSPLAPSGQSDGTQPDAAAILEVWRQATSEGKRRFVRDLGSELHDIYQHLASSEGFGFRKINRRGSSGAQSPTDRRSQDLRARQYELDFGDAHLSPVVTAPSVLQHAN